MIFYPHYIGDYMTATADLSNMEDLAYMRMLSMYYQHEKPLTLDKSRLFRSIKMFTSEEVDAANYVLERFFKKTESGYVNDRCETEISKLNDLSSKRSRAAKARWNDAKSSKSNASAYANAQDSDASACANGYASACAEHMHVVCNSESESDSDSESESTVKDMPGLQPDGGAKKAKQDEKQAICDRVIAHLNSKTGHHYRPAPNLKHVQKPLNAGYTEQDLIRVIDTKAAEWSGTDQAKFLRPSTLFGNGKFDEYLNQQPTLSDLRRKGVDNWTQDDWDRFSGTQGGIDGEVIPSDAVGLLS